MGIMIPYHQTLEKKEDHDYIGAVFKDFDHNVLIEDWYCEDPECDCMSVGLSFLVVNVKKTNGLFFLTLDMRSWEIKKRQIIDKKINTNAMIAEFMENLDEFKDTFKEHYRAVKEYGKRHHQAEPVRYQISGNIDADPLAFQYAGTKYFIADQYCTNPKCPCNSVTLSFIRLTKVKLKTPEFIIVLHLDTLQYEVKHNDCDLKKISNIVKYFLDKQGVLETLRHRYRKMKEDSGESHRKRTEAPEGKLHNDKPETKVIADPKIGRNDPCPCGSGKKYKKCCGLVS
jgi:hypothetical protein